MSADACYRALRTRDSRFDGVFYVGVKTTGVYCRPVCPAKTPAATRCEFFARAAQAEQAGFRACLRCRPELAPGLAPVDAVSRLVQLSAAQIQSGYLNDHSLEALAAELGVSSRHLRRAVQAQLGVSPVRLAGSRRLALAKQLLQDTQLPLAEVAFAAGFGSVRRFNAALQAAFGRAPSALRRARATASGTALISLRLDYRPPLDWQALLGFLRQRALLGVELVSEQRYLRSVTLGDQTGWIAVSAEPERAALQLQVSPSLVSQLLPLIARVRALFDLDARPDVIAAQLQTSALLGASVKRRAGLRVPGAFDGFETAVRAVLGQQVSVRGATTLAARLVERFGAPLRAAPEGVASLFPAARVLAQASVSQVRTIGLPAARAKTIVLLAEAVTSGKLTLQTGEDPAEFMAELQRIAGIGPWTAQYLAMRVLRWPDAFPSGDLAVRKALGVDSARQAEACARDWQPFRAYAVMHLWSSLSDGGGG